MKQNIKNKINSTNKKKGGDKNKVQFLYSASIISGKVHESLEDPISQLFYDISDSISPFLYRHGVTPNQITTLRLLVVLIVFFYLFEKKMYKSAAGLYLFTYFADCLDGHMARKYKMETLFGDFLDHFTDIFRTLLMLYFLSLYMNSEHNWVMFVIVLMLFISLIQMGCEERYINNIGFAKDSYVMQPIKCLCPEFLVDNEELEQTMEFSRLCGLGIGELFITIIIWNFSYFDTRL